MVTVEKDTSQKTQASSSAIKNLAWPTFAFLTVATTASIAQLPAMAEYGLGAITLYLIPAICFLIPVALVAAELAMGWRGGVFGWVSNGLGERAGFQAIWLQWIQSVALYPSLLSFAAASLAFAIGRPELGNNGLFNGAVILIIFWAATLVSLRGLSSTAKIANVGVLIGTVIPAAALILFMIAWFGAGKPSAMPLKTTDVLPRFTGIASIVLIVSNFIAFAGLEVSAVHIRELKKPKTDYLKVVLVTVILALLIYILGTISIAVAVPTAKIDLNGGAAQALTAYADGFGFGWVGVLLAVMLLLGAMAASASWVAGPSRGLLLVGQRGFLPRPLQRVNKAGVQAPLLIVQGIIVTILSLAFVFIPNVSSAFWMLQAMCAILYMLMYILFFISAWRLRRTQPNVKRPFKVPALPVVALVGTLAAGAAIIIGLFPPSQFQEATPLVYALMLIGGVLILAVPPQLIYQWRRPDWRDPAAVLQEAEE